MGSLPAETGAQDVLIDAEQPSRIYAVTEAGVYRSDDAGQTWELAADDEGAEPAAALALDPRDPTWMYALAPSGEVFFSEDGASSWRSPSERDCL